MTKIKERFKKAMKEGKEFKIAENAGEIMPKLSKYEGKKVTLTSVTGANYGNIAEIEEKVPLEVIVIIVS